VKEKIINLVSNDIKAIDLSIDDIFVSKRNDKEILNIVLDSSNIIDLNKITEASRIINKKLDDNKVIDDNIFEVDIYSKEKGDQDE
jgi:ribosome maturation factor RimP